MKSPSPQSTHLGQLDPKAFLADEELLKTLGARATPVPCKTDCVLFRQDAPPVGVYIVHDGPVTLSMTTPDGQSLFAVQALPGSLIGLPAVISNQPYSISAMAFSGAQIGFVSHADFTALMHADPHLSLKMLEVLAAEVRSARKALY